MKGDKGKGGVGSAQEVSVEGFESLDVGEKET